MSKKAEVLLHPVRMKIIQALLGGRNLTVAEMLKMLPEIPQATLYRHLNKLVSAKMVEVTKENQVRGTTEKIYGLNGSQTVLLQKDLENTSKEEHLKYFMTFLFQLMEGFSSYLDQEDIDLERDGVGYRQAAFYMSDEEFADFVKSMSTLVKKAMENKPNDQRKKRLLSTIMIPEVKKGEQK